MYPEVASHVGPQAREERPRGGEGQLKAEKDEKALGSCEDAGPFSVVTVEMTFERQEKWDQIIYVRDFALSASQA